MPSPATAPPSGSDWIHEIKHDGLRIMARPGVVTQLLPNATFRVKLENDHVIIEHTAGRMRRTASVCWPVTRCLLK